METPKRVDPLEFISTWVQGILDAEEDKGSGEDPEWYNDILND